MHAPQVSSASLRAAVVPFRRLPTLIVAVLVAALFPIRLVGAESWIAQDVGAVGLPGSSSYDPATDGFTVAAAGGGLTGVRDGFRYVSLPTSGDAQIVARLGNFTAAHPLARAGVMIRTGTGDDAPFAAVLLTQKLGVQLLSRAAVGGAVREVPSAPPMSDAPASVWLKLVRVGQTFRAYYSSGGAEWVPVGLVDVPMPAVVDAGLAVTSHDLTALASARFTDVAVKPPVFGTALLVTGDAALNAAELAIQARLENIGYTVHSVRAAGATPAGVAGKSIVLVSDTAGALPATLATATTPILAWSPAAFATLGLTGPTAGQAYGQTEKKEEAVTVVAPAHPLAAGFMGNVKVALPAAMNWGRPASGAVVVATGKRRTGEDEAVLFGYEVGATLAQGSALARRVGFFFTSEMIGTARDEGWRMFEAALAWTTNVPSTVALTAPPFGTVALQGAPLTLQATASDPDGSVVRVEFYIDGTKLAEVLQPPYTAVWANPVSGVYLLTAAAVDSRGGRTTSEPVALIVNAPPTVDLTSPLAGTVFQQSQPIPLAATARDSDGSIRRVTFFDGARPLGERTDAPYALSWTDAALGLHTLTAKAFDNHEAGGTSAAVQIFVNAPPTIALTAPTEGAIVPRAQPLKLVASATDGDGTIARVEFFVDDQSVGAKTSAPFELTWSSPVSGLRSLKAIATDNDAASATSAIVRVTVNAPPVAAVTAPADGQVFSVVESIAVAASVTDEDGTIAKVEFLVDGQPAKELTAAPYAFAWTGAAPGSHTLAVRATDNLGVAATSASRAISVVTDKDGDGMADVWEVANFGSLEAKPGDDPDQDGLSNLREFQTGRNPNLFEADAFVLSPPGIALWLRSDRGLAGADGAPIARWADQSGTANDALASPTGAQPLQVAAQANGLPVVRFDGVDDRMAVDLRGIAGTDFTMIAVSARRSAKAPAILVGGGSGTTASFGFGYSTDTQLGLNYGAGMLGAVVAGFSSPAFSVGTAGFDTATGHRLWRNGKLLGSDSSTAALAGFEAAFVGGDGTSANAFAGDVAEVIVYRGKIGDSHRDAVEKYLIAKYKISTGGTPTPGDSDGDGLLDAWELQWFGNLDHDGEEDFDGDGATNRQEMDAGTDPTDYYNGVLPGLSIAGGNGQSALPGEFLLQPLTVQVVAAGGRLLANAPITFTITGGQAGVGAAFGQATTNAVVTRTDASGLAKVFVKVATGAPGPTIVVQAAATVGTKKASVLFTADTLDWFPTPRNLAVELNAGETTTRGIVLQNPTASPVTYTLTPTNVDAAIDYATRTSDQSGGPTYVWNDIRATAKWLKFTSGLNDAYEAVDLSFAFPFYGSSFNRIYVNTNGHLTLGGPSAATNWSDVFPSGRNPPNAIAPFFSDLQPSTGGEIYVLDQGDRVTVQYDSLRNSRSDHSTATFQVILYKNGNILFLYKTAPYPTDAVVGIQNGDGTRGVTVQDWKTAVLRDKFAVLLTPTWRWLAVDPATGTLAAGERSGNEVTFDATQLAAGTYTGNITLQSNYTGRETINLSATLLVNAVPTAAITTPARTTRILAGQPLTITGTASDSDGVVTKVEFYDGTTKIGGATQPPYATTWSSTSIGTHTITLQATDAKGAIGKSKALTVYVDSDSDGDGLGDQWEIQIFGNLSQTGSGDYDGDGANNLEEYQRGLTVTNADTDGDGLTDQQEIAGGFDPFLADAWDDADGDGYPNAVEFVAGSHPRSATSVPAPTFIVDPSGGGTHTTIQAAINAATKDFQIIRVRPGIYKGTGNTNLTTSRRLMIVSEGGAAVTRIDGQNTSAGISLNNCLLRGFTFQNCRGSQGAGISAGGTTTIESCVVANCFATTAGGGVYSNGTITLRHCTIVDNRTDDSSGVAGGGGIYVNSNTLTLVNTICWGSTDVDLYVNRGVVFASHSVLRDVFAGEGNLQVDPRLTLDYRLRADSPLRAAGAILNRASTDIDGEPRPVTTAPDIGADQFVDSDNDGLADAWELKYLGTLARTAAEDPDGDGLDNLAEYQSGTSPTAGGDTDGDGLSDYDEVKRYGSNPLLADTDGDGMPDKYEVDNGLKVTVRDDMEDADGDGYPNIYEQRAGTGVNDPTSIPAANWIVDPTGAGGAFTTLQTAANATTADYQIIRVNPGVYKETGTIVLSISRFKTLVISAQGAANTIIDGENVRRGFASSKDCALVGFTIRNTPEKPSSSTGYGNVVSLSRCIGLLQNCVFVNNRGVGGIVSISASTGLASGTFRHCTFLNNLVAQGGTFYLTAAYAGGAKITVSDSILWDQGPTQILAYNTRVTITNSIVRGWPSPGVLATAPSFVVGTGVLTLDPKLTPWGHLTSDSPARGRALEPVYLDMDGEVRAANAPRDLGADQFVDSDGDGLADAWELKYFGSLTAQNGAGDPDNDGVTNLDESRNDSHPLQALDSDGDGISDRDEILIYRTNPFLADTDGDEIPDALEIQYGFDPLRDDAMEDADGDGYPNIFEIKRGSNPKLASSIPAPDYTVAPSGGTHTTIKAAFDAANNSGQNFRIVRVSPGTYSIANQSVFLQGQRTLVISSGGAANTIIDGGNVGSSLAGISLSTRSALHGFTIRNINHTFSQGGAFNISSSPRISNCVIRNNSGEMGAVAVVNPGRPVFVHCTIVNNTARDSASSFILGVDSVLELNNCIVWNPATSTEIKGFGQIVARNTIFRTGALLGVGIDTDPLVASDGHLRFASPARGAGSTAYAILTDMDGETRPVGVAPDLGADQFSGLGNADADEDGMLDTWETANGLNPLKADAYEDADNDGIANIHEFAHNTNPRDAASKPVADLIVDGTPGAADPSHGIYATIRDAVAALTKPYQIIDVRPGTYAGDISITGTNARGVLLRSTAGAGKTIIDGGGVAGGISASTDAIIAGFTVANCVNSAGAGLYVDLAQVKVQNCLFRNNTASEGQGGAIYVSGGTVQVQHCTLIGNKANGSLGCGIGALNGSVQVQNSIVWNAAAAASGASEIEAVPATAIAVHASIVRSGGHYTDGGGNLGVDPLAAPHTGHLPPNSAAIDAADPAVSLPVDFEGEARPNGARPDIGADEFGDTDGDGLNDGWERAYFGDLSKTASGDADGDGLTNLEEFQVGTSPMKTDTDDDGLSDFAEVRTHRTNPVFADTDGDGTPDGIEVAQGLDPLGDDNYADSDGDGIPNRQELALGTDPRKADTDGDGLIDGLELAMSLNPLVKDYVGPDEVPPPAPPNLKIDEVTPSSVKLSWSAVTDPSAPVTYAVWRNGLLIDRTTATTFTDQYGDPGVYPFTYTVTASDGAGNISPLSAPLQGSTAAGFTPLPGDADGDGIPDALDARPNDPSNAFEDDDGDGIANRDDLDPQTYDGPPPNAKILNNDDKVNYVKGESVRLTVRVTDPNAQVTLYRNGVPLGIASRSSDDLQEYTWQNLPVGAHYIRAVVRDARKATLATKMFLVDVVEMEADITFVGPHPTNVTFGRNYSIRSRLDGIDVDRPILRNTLNADYSPADPTQGVDVHYERYYRGGATVPIYANGQIVGSFTIPSGERHPLVVLREFRDTAGAFVALRPYVIDPSTPAPGQSIVKTLNFSSATIVGGFTPYLFYGWDGGIDFTAAAALVLATNDAMEYPVEVGPGGIADTRVGANSRFMGFYSKGDFAISVRTPPYPEYYNVPDFPSNISSSEMAFTPLWYQWRQKYGGHAYTFIANTPAFAGRRTLLCYYRLSAPQRGLLWYGDIGIQPEVRITPYNVGTILYPGGRGHPANNLTPFNLPVFVNDDSDDQPSVADYADATFGVNDDDIVKFTIKLDLRGRSDARTLRVRFPADTQGQPVFRARYGNNTFPVSGNELTLSLSANPALTIGDGLDFYVEALRPMLDARIEVDVLDANGVPLNRLWPTLSPAETLRLDALPRGGLLVDVNRDGKIEASDAMDVNSVFRFWLNDDDDSSDISATGVSLIGNPDEPGRLSGFWEFDGRTPDHANPGVDGRSDLLDFFPIALDIKQLLWVLPHTTAGITYKLKQADSALNFVYTDLTRAEAFDYLKYNKERVAYGLPSSQKKAHEAPTVAITAAGVPLDADFLTRIKVEAEKGVILIEGKVATDKPLRLVVEKTGVGEIAQISLNIKISEVEKMYRWVNLRAAGGQSATRQTDLRQPAGYPDSATNGKMFIFVHGYNVSERQSRAWNAEAFKRMWQSGSRAMFTAVSWNGDHSQIPYVGVAPDYWDNITRAFQTAQALAPIVNNLPGSSKVIAGHSMGNVVSSAAVTDHGMNVTKYLMVDAAVALEAYDTSALQVDAMRPPDWAPYTDRRVWPTDWYKLFPSGDGRRGLTWMDRFGNISNAINIYSSGEEVLNNNDLTPGKIPDVGSERSWIVQEMAKGTMHLAALLSFDIQGGWGFNSEWLIAETQTIVGLEGTITTYRRRTTAEAAALTDDQLRATPFFRPFKNANFTSPTGGSAAASALVPRADALGGAIPALSFPAGRNPVPLFSATRNRDLMAHQDGWPQERLNDRDAQNRWFHSDIKNIAYVFNHGAWDLFVTEGNLK